MNDKWIGSFFHQGKTPRAFSGMVYELVAPKVPVHQIYWESLKINDICFCANKSQDHPMS